MTLKAFPFFLSSITYLILGLWVIFREKNRTQVLYGAVCIVTSFWQGIWVTLFSNLPMDLQYLSLKISYSMIVFIPSTFYHFVIDFTQNESDRSSLRWVYGLSSALALSIWLGKFINGFNNYPWGLSARAGLLHPLFVCLVTFVVIRMLYLLRKTQLDPKIPTIKKRQLGWLLAAVLVYSLGSLDLLSNYGVSFFPLSFLFTGFALGFFSYAIFRYEFLAIAISSENENERLRRLAASEEMTRIGVSAAFPLVSQGELLGYLLLGEKMSEESYGKEDILLLRIVANQAALAYQRVRFLEMAVRGARTEMLGEIAGGFAHEIKTPLANISLPAEITYMELLDVEQGKRKVEDVLPQIKERMKDIMLQTMKASDKIEAVRQFSKPGDIQVEHVELQRVLHSSLSLLDHMIRKLAVKVLLNIPEKIAPVRGNPKQLEIVLVNLIKNAAEAMANMSSTGLARNLWINAFEDNGWIVIEIKDSGPGIRKTDVGHVFEAYFTTKGSTGTGMGLFLSHQVIKAHGGTIDVKSEEGCGTLFTIRLPKFIAQPGGVHQAA